MKKYLTELSKKHGELFLNKSYITFLQSYNCYVMYYKLLSVLFLIGVIFISCSKNLSYEDQISNILVYEEGMREYTDEQFEKIFKLIEENPETFNIDFEGRYRFNSILSDDKKVKAYCFDISDVKYGSGESRVILQYDLLGRINTVLLPDTITAIENIYFLTDNRYLFISSYGGFHHRAYMYKQANVYEVGKQNVSKLNGTFSTGDGKIDEIEVVYEQELSSRDDEIYVLLAYRNDGIIDGIEEIDKLAILYNQFKKELYVADIGKATEGSQVMTGTFRHYKWDKNLFHDITLINPLEFINEDYFIRIEQENDGSCTYMSWNGGKKNGKPNLVIKNGIRRLINWNYRCPYNEWISDDESTPDAEEFIFLNNGYRYRYITGWLHGDLLHELEVRNPDKDIIYSGNFKQIE